MQIQPERLTLRKRELDDDCYGTSPGYCYFAQVPGFDLEYEISYDNSDAYGEMARSADDTGVVHMDDWNRILRKYGEPSENDDKWSVVLIAGGNTVTKVLSNVCVFNAQAALQIDFKYRINVAAGIYIKEPDLYLMFNPLKVLEEEGA